MQLGDYADGGWLFLVECKACGRQSGWSRTTSLTATRLRSVECAWKTSRAIFSAGTAAAVRHTSKRFHVCRSRRSWGG